jgi:hypothetical protein
MCAVIAIVGDYHDVATLLGVHRILRSTDIIRGVVDSQAAVAIDTVLPDLDLVALARGKFTLFEVKHLSMDVILETSIEVLRGVNTISDRR